ncbi:MAG: hypothetical protein HYV52_01440 [Parcubacteria group bacterium]|nr:hypothetical protein [Parcubacteria group bacterium]
MKFINLFFNFHGPSILYGFLLFFILAISFFRFRWPDLKYKILNPKYVFFALGLILIIFLAQPLIFTFAQYAVWKTSPVMIYVFPPHTPGLKIFGLETPFSGYFLRYSWQHFIKAPFFAAIASLILSSLIFIFYKYFNRFELRDVYFAAIGGLVGGWPGFMIYIFLVPVLAVFWLLALKIFKPENQGELILTPFWLVAALIVVLFGDIIIRHTQFINLIV